VHRPILTSHAVLYCVKRSLHKRSLINLFTQARLSMDAEERGIVSPAL